MTTLTHSETLSFSEARIAIEAMGFSFMTFVADVGERAHYATSDVLGWLGY